jgi:cathepsin B
MSACFSFTALLAVSSAELLWKSDAKQFKGWTFDEKQSLMGVLPRGETNKNPSSDVEASTSHLPDSFDWRKASPDCIHSIRDQGRCGGCWAEAATEVLSDRFCIQTNGTTNVVLSPLYLIACDKKERGCTGGFPEKAWSFLAKIGVYSDSCIPYNLTRSLLCPLSKCEDGSSFRNQTKYKAKGDTLHDFAVPASRVKEELLTNGPVEAVFTVYEDFMQYSSGVYHHVEGKRLGLHAVKVLGWGVVSNGTTNTSYWTCANSWNKTWGEVGFFRIKHDDCGIDLQMTSAMPLLPK